MDQEPRNQKNLGDKVDNKFFVYLRYGKIKNNFSSDV